MDKLDPIAPGSADRGKWELRAWSLIAVAALAVSGVLAPMLALSRVPGLEAYLPWAETAFQRAIIEHVVFSVVVWTLAVFGALMCIAVQGNGTPKANRMGATAVRSMVLVFVLLFAPALMDSARPSLNNYVPVMIHPLYYAGLGVLFAALALSVARLWLNRARLDGSPLSMGASAAAVAYVLALLCFLIAAWLLSGQAPSRAFNEDLFWGGGHVLQIVNTIMMLTAWAVLGELALGRHLGRPLVSPGALKAAFVLCLIAAVAAPVLYAFYTFESGDLSAAQSKLKYVLGLPALIVVFSALRTLKSAAPVHLRSNPAFTALALSVILFAAGGVMGFFADGADTRTPAHYHGVLGAVNLAFFGLLLFVVLPLLGRSLKPTRWRFAPLYIYAAGQLMQSLGLFIAAAPRKTMGAAQALETPMAKMGMHVNNSGGAIAVIGGILFVWIAGRALLRRQNPDIPDSSE